MFTTLVYLSENQVIQEVSLMRGRTRIQQLLVCVLVANVIGCGPAHPLYLTSKGQIDKNYISSATRISYPDTNIEPSLEVTGSGDPFTVANPDIEGNYYDITLEEAICIAMQNSKVIRTLNGVGFSGNGIQGVPQGLLSSPQGTATVYDVALTESDPRYGVQAALSQFDAILKSSLSWGTEDRGTMPKSASTTTETGTFQTSIQKTNATGGTVYATNGNNYYAGSRYAQPFWAAYVEGGISQPLLQGRGVQFNRIAGPGSIPGFYNGVSIARINTDQTLADFERASRDLVFDVEKAYWNLYLAYHTLHSVKTGYAAAAKTYETILNKYRRGHKEGTAMAEGQARTQLCNFRKRAEQAQGNLFKAERMLRYIMGISPTDGRFLRPSTEPNVAPIHLNWNDTVSEALVRSPELRKQRWEVKKQELQLLASKNYLLPRLDLNVSGRFNGVGEDWIDSSSANSSAYGSLTKSEFGDYQAGLSFSQNIGKRKELAAVQNSRLTLIRSQVLLQEQELELVHQLQESFNEIATNYQVSVTGLQTRLAAQASLKASTKLYENGATTLDQVLTAQQNVAEAETDFYSSLVAYNLGIAELHRRKGSLLEYNNVYLSEGPWPAKAYSDARELARKRDAGHYLNYGYTRPQVFSKGEYQQFQNYSNSEDFRFDNGNGGGNETIIEEITPERAPAQEIKTDDYDTNLQTRRLPATNNSALTQASLDQQVYAVQTASKRPNFGTAPAPQKPFATQGSMTSTARNPMSKNVGSPIMQTSYGK
ncbi:MAG: TolC family protein [Thermoguttaceae bacterium]